MGYICTSVHEEKTEYRIQGYTKETGIWSQLDCIRNNITYIEKKIEHRFLWWKWNTIEYEVDKTQIKENGYLKLIAIKVALDHLKLKQHYHIIRIEKFEIGDYYNQFGRFIELATHQLLQKSVGIIWEKRLT